MKPDGGCEAVTPEFVQKGNCTKTIDREFKGLTLRNWMWYWGKRLGMQKI